MGLRVLFLLLELRFRWEAGLADYEEIRGSKPPAEERGMILFFGFYQAGERN